MSTHTTKSRGIRAAVAGLVVALAATGALALATPKAAFANDGSASQVTSQAPHTEGESVTIWPEGDSVYAEWHRSNSGKWWATFWTYNGTKVFAKEAPAGCGWTFHCYDENGKWTQIIRREAESTADGQLGPQGIASHWQELNGNRWF